MKLHRFFIAKQEARERLIGHIKQRIILLPPDLSKQAIKVLRLRRGDQFIVLDNTGLEYLVELEIPDSKSVSAKIIEQHLNTNEPRTSISLYQSLLPREKFELALQKGTEVGIKEFFPIKTTFTIYGKDYVNDQKLLRWQSVIKEASEQSERGVQPKIFPALDFKEAITQALAKGLVLLTHPYKSETSSEILRKFSQDDKHISIFIGPEGGFSDEEVEFAKTHGAKIISLGKRILRSETAGPVLAAIILHDLNDL